MTLEFRQKIKLQQNLQMTPELQQAIKILQFSNFELESFLNEQLVSNPVFFAVEAIANKQIEFGVNAAASDPVIVDKWLKNIKELAQEFDVIDHLS